jgi:hypothetical protein
LLALARSQQYVLDAQQLPAPTPGRDPSRTLVSNLLAGRVQDLTPVRADVAGLGDSPLDVGQRDAVAKALGTPDICLIQGVPGSGKSRVAAEIITRATARGERILLLAPTAAPIDRVLELIDGSQVVFPIRCLGPEETAASLPPSVRALIFGERLTGMTQQALAGAARQAVEAEETSGRVRKDEPTLLRLAELANQHEKTVDAISRLSARLENGALDAEVQTEGVNGTATGAFGTEVARIAQMLSVDRAVLEQALALAQSAAETDRIEQAHLEAQWHQYKRYVPPDGTAVWRVIASLWPGLRAKANHIRQQLDEVREKLSQHEAEISQQGEAIRSVEAKAGTERTRAEQKELGRRRHEGESTLARGHSLNSGLRTCRIRPRISSSDCWTPRIWWRAPFRRWPGMNSSEKYPTERCSICSLWNTPIR